MKLCAFLHSDSDSPTTLSEIKCIHEWASTDDYLGLYAYATQSGASAFDLALGEDFWTGTPSRWLFGIDYGRTQPQAIRHINEKPNAQVRLYDGAWIVNQNGFLPRRDFHVKTSLLLNPDRVRFGMVVGSGNFRQTVFAKVLRRAQPFRPMTKVRTRERCARQLRWHSSYGRMRRRRTTY